MHEAFLEASSEVKYSFRIKCRTGENMRKFSIEQGQRSMSQGRGILWRPPAQLVNKNFHICD